MNINSPNADDETQFTYQYKDGNKWVDCTNIYGFYTKGGKESLIRGQSIFLYTKRTESQLSDTFAHEMDHLLKLKYFMPEGLYKYMRSDWYTQGIVDIYKAECALTEIEEDYQVTLPNFFYAEGTDYKELIAWKKKEKCNLIPIYSDMLDLHKCMVDICLDLKKKIDDREITDMTQVLENIHQDSRKSSVIERIFFPIKIEILKRIHTYIESVSDVHKLIYGKQRSPNPKGLIAGHFGLNAHKISGNISLDYKEGSLRVMCDSQEGILALCYGAKIRRKTLTKKKKNNRSNLSNVQDNKQKKQSLSNNNQNISKSENLPITSFTDYKPGFDAGITELLGHIKGGSTMSVTKSRLIGGGKMYDHYKRYKTENPLMHKALHARYDKNLAPLIDVAYQLKELKIKNITSILAPLPSSLWPIALDVYRYSNKSYIAE